MKLERMLAIAGIILLLLITIAIINTYTDLFKEVFKEDKQAASVEEKPLSSPKPKDGKMDFGREGSGKKVSGVSGDNKEKDNLFVSPATKVVVSDCDNKPEADTTILYGPPGLRPPAKYLPEESDDLVIVVFVGSYVIDIVAPLTAPSEELTVPEISDVNS